MDDKRSRVWGRILAAGMLFVTPLVNAGLVTYDTWTSNENGSGSYIFTVDDNTAGTFNYELTVSPWNAEALGLFLDFGSQAADASAANLSGANVSLYGRNQANNLCGAACNLNGLTIPGFDGIWTLVFRLGQQGFDNIQTFAWSTSDFGLSLDDIGVVGVRAQQLCQEGETLNNGDAGCDGSDKSYASRTVDVPEPGSIALFGLGLLGLALSRSRRS